MASITLENVGLTFKVRQEHGASFKDFVLRYLRGGAKSNPVLTVHALAGITAEFREGDRIGVIGHNGAGKSTFLQMLAGIYPLSSGRREVRGRISSLFNLTLGFEQYASGRDNIRYRGYLMGETPRSLERKIDSIIEFAEIGEFIDTPIRYYSSGMKVRLAFAIATAIEPEILLMDECFSAGDRAFRRKATDRMSEMMGRARLMVLVSHDMDMLERLSNRVLWLEQGRIKRDGPATEVIGEYNEFMRTTRNRAAGGATGTRAA